MPLERNTTFAALDIGSYKISCLIAKVDMDGKLSIEGFSMISALGFAAGNVVDMAAAEASVRAAVEEAEHKAGDTVKEVYVSLSGGDPTSYRINASVPVLSDPIDENDLLRVHDEAWSHLDPDDFEVIHAIPVDYTVDDVPDIQDPRGMHGRILQGNMHMVAAVPGPVRNITYCVEQLGLTIKGMVVSAYAAGHGCLSEEERDLGTVVIDLGGGLTNVGVYLQGRLIFVDAIPYGGQRITRDIAFGFNTTEPYAEQLKTKYGNVLSASTDEHELLNVPMIGDRTGEEQNTYRRSELVAIIRHGIEDIFDTIRDSLDSHGINTYLVKRVVLTGGGAQLQGIREAAAQSLSRQVTVAAPMSIKGLPDFMLNPAYSGVVGLLKYAIEAPDEAFSADFVPDEVVELSSWKRIGRWVKANFW